jgi:TfoX/Sxy family transcriptional regulator of competence genes
MAYDETLADRVREALAAEKKKVEEKQMFSGLTFMVNGKMCVGVHTDELMVRFDPELQEKVLSIKGTREMDFTNKIMKGYVFVDKNVVKNKKDLDYWVDLALDFNDRAKASKKAKPKKPKRK